jgi:hypothetical protein
VDGPLAGTALCPSQPSTSSISCTRPPLPALTSESSLSGSMRVRRQLAGHDATALQSETRRRGIQLQSVEPFSHLQPAPNDFGGTSNKRK